MTDFRDPGLCPKCMQPGRSGCTVNEMLHGAADLGLRIELAEGLIGWAVHGHMPGGFLTACIENDLRGAAERADRGTPLWVIITFLNTYMPSQCWGSLEAVKKWSERMEKLGAPA